MKLRVRGTQRPITIQENRRLGSGGEATVYSVPERADCAVKVFHSHLHRDWKSLEAKLTLMRSHPPVDPTQSLQHASIAWPTELVEDSSGAFRGYLMPFVASARGVFEYFNPKSRRDIDPAADYRFLVRVAQNLAASMQAIHNGGYVIGDVNEQNVLVSRNALITIIDTDSFQIPSTNGALFHCTVGKFLYLPQEMHGKPLNSTVRTRQHDLFGLAVLIYQLLMEGTHPYAGRDLGDDILTIEDRIRLDRLPSQGSKSVHPSPLAPPPRMLPLSLRQLFIRAFANSQQRSQGNSRPEGQEWAKGLAAFSDSLITCSKSPTRHFYGKHLSDCPWCQRRDLFGGFDTFGKDSKTSVLPPVPPPEVLWTVENSPPKAPKKPPASSVSKCPICAQTCESDNALAKHLRSMHATIPIPVACRICSKRKPFSSKAALASHFEAKHGQKAIAEVILQLVQQEFRCPSCNKEFSSQAALDSHSQAKHSPASQRTTTHAAQAPKKQPDTTRTRSSASKSSTSNPGTGCCVMIVAILMLAGLSRVLLAFG